MASAKIAKERAKTGQGRRMGMEIGMKRGMVMGMRARERIQSHQRRSEQNLDSETRAGERITSGVRQTM